MTPVTIRICKGSLLLPLVAACSAGDEGSHATPVGTGAPVALEAEDSSTTTARTALDGQPGARSLLDASTREVGSPEGSARTDEPVCERTSMTERDLAVALARGHTARHGREAEERRLMGAWALAALEGSRGEFVYAYNFANIPRADDAPSCLHPTAVEQGAPVKLRRFMTPTEGAAAFWAALGDTSGSSLQQLDHGEWSEFASSVSRNGFHRSNAARYRDGVSRLARYGMAMVLPKLRLELLDHQDGRHATGPLKPRAFRAYSKLPLSVFVSPSLSFLASVDS